MPSIKWRVIKKKPARELPHASFRFSHPFLRALRRFVAEERQLARDERISQAAVLFTLALRGSARLRQIYNQEKAEDWVSESFVSSGREEHLN